MTAEPASAAEIECMAFTIQRWVEFRGVPLSAVLAKLTAPISMVLYCPVCGLQHIDAPENGDRCDDAWTNPPHRSHLCARCRHIWRPADVPTEGVAAIQTRGAADSPKAARPNRHKFGTKMPLKIAVYAIAKNEAAYVAAFCAAAAEADYIVIADTGSTDNTVALAMGYALPGLTVARVTIDPWRFDAARNAALDLVPADADVCVSVDLDEILQPGWRAEIERCWGDGTTRMRYFYDWSKGVKYKAEKIHARHGFKWAFPVHEDIVSAGAAHIWCESDALLIVHHPDETKSRAGYRPLLKLSFEENPTDPRAAIYYGRDLAQQRDAAAVGVLQHYLAMPGATWACERSYAMRLIADADPANKEAWLLRAAAEYPQGREPWCALAQLYYNHRLWTQCYGMATRAIAVTWRDFAYCGEPAAWGAWPHDLASIAAWNLGTKDAALEHALAASALDPDNARIDANIKAMTA